MGSIFREIPGGVRLIDWFGDEPSFHDAEIVQLELVRRSESSLRVHWWKLKKSAAFKNAFEPDADAIVTFIMADICDLRLTDFSQQNVISELSVRRVPMHPERGHLPGQVPGTAWEIELGGCYGLYGTIKCRGLRIGLQAGKPTDSL